MRVQKIIGLYKALHSESGAAYSQHRCMFRVTLRTLAYKIVEGDLPACTFDLRTALAARAQKQRFGSTLIGGGERLCVAWEHVTTPNDFADAHTGCVECQDAARRDSRSRRRVECRKRQAIRNTSRTAGRVPEDSEGVEMTMTGRQSAPSADLAWCGSPVLSVPSVVSLHTSCISTPSAPRRLDRPAEPVSRHAG